MNTGSTAAGPPPGGETPSSPPLVRPMASRYVGGVAAGFAQHLGLAPWIVRVALVVLTPVLNGVPALLYCIAWMLMPQEDDGVARLDANGLGWAIRGRPSRYGVARRRRPGTVAAARRAELVRLLIVGLGMLVAAGVLFIGGSGHYHEVLRLAPVAVIVVGLGVALTQLDEGERRRWFGSRPGLWWGVLLRSLVGSLLVVVGVGMLLVRQVRPGQITLVLLAGLSVLVGLGLVLAPLGILLWRTLEAERALRVRETERAEITAHLHDSVLQTLALIQRHPGDPEQVTRLARAQERELRAWLYGGEGARQEVPSSLREAVRRAVAEIEDAEGVAISPVVVGDAPMSESATALVQALREATSNAARHGRVGVSVYVECDDTGVEAFVRDRGEGIDLAAIPPDRFGVRRSIIDRMARNGGTGVVRAAAGGGTEVILRLPAQGHEDREDA